MDVLVIDNGLSTEFARHLGESGLFNKVGYFSSWQSDFVATRERAVGTGFDEFERIYSVSEDMLAMYDAFIFPDLYWKDLAIHLRDAGCPVWSAFEMEDLELDRLALLHLQAELGLNRPNCKVVEGVDDALRVANDGDFIKITGYARGDGETARHDARNPTWSTRLRERLGPLAHSIPIIVQEPIEDDHEVGFDTLIIKGRCAYPFLIGYEAKDSGYLAKVVNEMPAPLMREGTVLLDYLEGSDYTNFLSTEYRGGTLIDITTRNPSPPGDLHLILWANLRKVVRDALTATPPTDVKLVPQRKYAVELIVHNNEPSEFVYFDIPPAYRNFVGVRRAFKKNGLVWAAPTRDDTLAEIAGFSGYGDTPDEAIEMVKEVKKAVKMSSSCSVDDSALRDLLETAERGEKEGIPF